VSDAIPAVRFTAVGKRYGRVAAVDEVSFEIARGTLVTLLGPSGCGKTTTLRLIAGLEHATSGRIEIGGKDVTRLSAAERDVSMVFQSYALFPHMTVLENASYGLRASGIGRTEAERQARDKLALVGLAGFDARLPSELSGGQQQRVAVARAIVLEPQVLLFDEPLSNLDAKLRRRVREEIRALQQQLRLTVVYVTHDQQEALAVSDRVIVMNAGRIAQDAAPRALYEQPASRFIADFIGDANLLPVTVRRTDPDTAPSRRPGRPGRARRAAARNTARRSRRPARPADEIRLSRQPHGIRGGGRWPAGRGVRHRTRRRLPAPSRPAGQHRLRSGRPGGGAARLIPPGPCRPPGAVASLPRQP
jgi:ABC-type Fe3+/spermidine/putrescine transport system ATPase subunit